MFDKELVKDILLQVYEATHLSLINFALSHFRLLPSAY
jgi:hypothetical protein